jgi:dihydrofolate reductase
LVAAHLVRLLFIRAENGDLMAKIVFDISMSLDGYVTAENPRPEGGMGIGENGEILHAWAFKSEDPRNQELLKRGAGLGALVAGRNTFDVSIEYWEANGPTGEARAPVVVVTHEPPQKLPKDHVYTFVDNVKAAAKEAGKLAGEKDIAVMGGADIARQFLEAGLLDEISIHLAPVLFGKGTRLFEEFPGAHIQLEPVEVVDTKEAVHLRYRVVK